MDRPCVQLLSEASYYNDHDLGNKRNRMDSNPVRKIRVICYDPDATDCSSDEDEEPCWLRKRLVQEISLPNPSSSTTSSRSEVEVSYQASNNEEISTRVSSGVRRRGKPAAEIRHPIDGVRVCNTEEESVNKTYELKTIEFDALVEADKSQVSSCSENVEVGVMDGENIEIKMLDLVSIEEQFECSDALDSLFVNDYGEVFDDVPLCEFDGLDGFIDLPSFDFELGKEDLAWIEEPLNIDCYP